MASRVLLDTSAYAHFRAGHDDVVRLVGNAELVQLPVTVLGELEAGFQLGTRGSENRSTLSRFLSEPWVSVLEITRDVALRYGRVFAALRQAGTPIPSNDIWIAATALDAGSELVTFDSDFEYVDGLDCTLLRSV